MISNLSIIGCVLSLLVSTVLPVGFIIWYGFRHKGEGVVSAWIIGAIGFLVPQMFIRVPILQFLNRTEGFMEFTVNHFVLYALALGVTAGLFEYAGRFLVAKYIDKKGRLNYTISLAAGLGHGGIEAIILVGMTYVNNLTLFSMIRSGSFDTLVAQYAATGMDVSQLMVMKDALLNTPSIMYFLGGFERILAMFAHVGMSMVVCYTMAKGKTWLGFLICVGYHTFIDTVSGLISMLANVDFGAVISQNTMIAIVYPLLIVCAALALYVTLKIKKQWNREEAYDPEA